jgi:hypothetical protein
MTSSISGQCPPLGRESRGTEEKGVNCIMLFISSEEKSRVKASAASINNLAMDAQGVMILLSFCDLLYLFT